ncbi:hypothetical protein A3H78_01325 [Candidatus Roizmanbacteria bacterium RIFCSPLOWO2_02_FULL_36_11]|uniref:L-asparaginase N-terminal domain-containing protein n=1 Tax=Candidatus Roizmanbacteria bacterium RIFCSPLOWO2_02_FULL_36_11 TaxID=1802071 RepID=A0A1F7JFA7_9BACT|nr:MAG: hypothetical protein A3H78_01325 [Candidatus Roizmanbacteria bacterium RIFCSPLOWO2_02_FULL_36_11]
MKILFIQTGGSIDKDYPKKVMGYHFELGKPAFKAILKKINPCFKFESITAFKKDSLDMTEKDRDKLYTICMKSNHDKIVITHGTDTMVKTARVLSAIKNKAIILTGALKPEKFYESEADFNLGVAVGAVNTLQNGVYIAMNGRVYDWDKCHKDQKTAQFVEGTSD